MEWLIEKCDTLMSAVRSGPFFKKIKTRDYPVVARRWLGLWLPQLLHQSVEYTSALALRSALCRDDRYFPVFRDHDVHEGEHPDMLRRFALKNGIALDAQPTVQTIDSLAFCWRSALRQPPELQVLTLNLISETVALEFYRSVIPFLEWLDLPVDGYWIVHKHGDEIHRRMGLDLLPSVEATSPTGVVWHDTMVHCSRLYHSMLTSWATMYYTAIETVDRVLA